MSFTNALKNKTQKPKFSTGNLNKKLILKLIEEITNNKYEIY